MRAVKSKDTGAEMTVRRLVHRLGYRYRLHGRGLPGMPDLVFPGRRAVIFVHGCFWHQHECPRGDRVPKTRREYWAPKLRRNRERDLSHQERLRTQGWRVLVVWECETRDKTRTGDRIKSFLEGAPNRLATQPD